MTYKTGIGYDIHRLVEGRKLFLGAVEIPYIKGLLGHSDGDVLLHAVCDALLGAMGMGDIGEHFPDTDEKYRDIQSVELIKAVNDLIKAKKFRIGNIDVVVIAQEPSLVSFKKQIKHSVAKILNIPEGIINIKAKTNEGLGALGNKEAIACYAIAMVGGRE